MNIEELKKALIKSEIEKEVSQRENKLLHKFIIFREEMLKAELEFLTHAKNTLTDCIKFSQEFSESEKQADEGKNNG